DDRRRRDRACQHARPQRRPEPFDRRRQSCAHPSQAHRRAGRRRRMSIAPEATPAPRGVWALIRSDIRRKQEHYVLVDRFFNKVVKVLVQHGTIAVAVYRIGHWAVTRPSWGARALARVFYTCLAVPVRWVSKVTIDPRTPIGPGFVIHNFSAVHVEAERIGANFTINQGV